MTWTNLLANKEAQKHKTSKKELDNMRALIARDLADASLAGLGKAAHRYADYFETCRRKRNTIDYTFSNVATETEAKEILVQAKRFYGEVEDWITKNHPVLKM